MMNRQLAKQHREQRMNTMATNYTETELASQVWENTRKSRKGERVTVTLSIQPYEISCEYIVRTETEWQRTTPNGKFVASKESTVQSFDSKKQGVAAYNYELMSLNCPDLDAKRITY